MGYTTDFLGHIDIDPPLNDTEIAYLSAFRRSRRWDRPGGPYDVPPNPFADERVDVDIDAYNRPAPGQPQLWCQWAVCWDGCCLTFDGDEKFYEPERWLRYLIDNFLVSGGKASTSGLPIFEEFSFSHRLDGLIIGCRRDTREMFALCVDDSVVRRKVLVAGDESYSGRGRLPYEEAIDRWTEELAAARRGGRGPRAVGAG